MYDYIKGKVTRVTPEYLVIEQQGIGWQIFAPNPYSFGTEDLQVFLHHHVREDAQLLFGFPTFEQRELFRKLISVSGIGPKGALAILASGQPQHVIEAIEREDESYLVKFPGVGKKTARQMILDLKGKLTEFFGDPFDSEETTTLLSNDLVELEEAMLALGALGYSEREINKVKPQLRELDLDTEGFMKKALQLLLKQN
ncbi:Holliday junction branch migration protein RuvA [Planococcus kocurii]|uniref:Holliday junction branch migration complex subunit RuvA n=2 Tax=Planococcus TaxID=1372 RepID=A0ABM5WX81_9BACL|nr:MULTISPECIES: Holliday junction branch migration protein RuvA [Planococcus]ALS78967.1 Holliday junction ATP-dependent DNA helicase RuvA [Planococcus kocurii]AQU79075.1 Holliday junction branch migration protein RuvA [Planococcus faecalis]KAA0957835.1 Holliday junction branch migration protein RuvA [Planococcus sp. ANT_H30]OHX51724.1 Holliday junction DNA helicase RuvA [Planococcus faecalis]